MSTEPFDPEEFQQTHQEIWHQLQEQLIPAISMVLQGRAVGQNNPDYRLIARNLLDSDLPGYIEEDLQAPLALQELNEILSSILPREMRYRLAIPILYALVDQVVTDLSKGKE